MQNAGPCHRIVDLQPSGTAEFQDYSTWQADSHNNFSRMLCKQAQMSLWSDISLWAKVNHQWGGKETLLVINSS